MSSRTVLTIGNFDGVHLGHRAILRRARELASGQGTVLALTFEPFPARVLRPQVAPVKLAGLEERVAALRGAGADRVEVVQPTHEFLHQTPDEFLHGIVQRYAPWAIVEGGDFRFGRGRAGDMALLAERGAALGFTAVAVDPVTATMSDLLSVPVSSSMIRWLLSVGRVRDAALALGRPYELRAVVVKGEQRGQTIGVPTANLDPAALADRAVPAHGVYAGRATLAGGEVRAAAISVGVKPTFHGTHRVVEAHLLDYAGDLYGRPLSLMFLRWLRDQHPFPTPDALRDQLRRDLAETRRLVRCGALDDDARTGGTSQEPQASAAGSGR